MLAGVSDATPPSEGRGRPARRPRRHGWWRLLGALLPCLLVAACSSPHGRQATATSRQPSAEPTHRDYWPTAGWRTAAPYTQGMDPQVLDDLDTQVPERYPQVRSLLVVRHGYLVYERYWQGFDAADGQEIQSVTKSIISALVGIAVGEGRLSKRLFRSRDWVVHILGRRLTARPGTTFAYSNASSHLLSAIVADATGQSTLAFARARLFGPLGIQDDNVLEPLAGQPPTPAQVQAYQRAAVAWPRDPQGYHFGFGETKLPARDLAKFGYLYLNGGRWNGTQVVPADYVRASTQPPSNLPRFGPGGGYGYGWWTTSVNLHPSFAAVGIGGQRILVIPDLDLVVVITADAQQQREERRPAATRPAADSRSSPTRSRAPAADAATRSRCAARTGSLQRLPVRQPLAPG
jgi:CubicO group peptidase (beta-lactamase class C family)